MPEATVLAPGSCGELVQGTVDGIHFHISCPVNLFSRVTVSLASGGSLSWPEDCPKAAAALRAALASNGGGEWGGRLSVRSPIPRGKGMASSTADILGSVAAARLALGTPIGPEETARIALSIEPSDGTIFPGIVLFDHRGGRLLKHLGPPPPLHIVVLDFGGEVDTIEFNRVDRSALLRFLEPRVAEAAALVEAGIRQGDTALIGEGATLSALAHQPVLHKPYLDRVLALSREAGAVGVCVGHSGTVVGALVDPRNRSREEVARFLRGRLPEVEQVFLVSLIGGGYRPCSREKELSSGGYQGTEPPGRGPGPMMLCSSDSDGRNPPHRRAESGPRVGRPVGPRRAIGGVSLRFPFPSPPPLARQRGTQGVRDFAIAYSKEADVTVGTGY